MEGWSVAYRWSVGIAFLASHKLSAYNAISLRFLNSLGNLSRNKPRNRLPNVLSSGRRANMVSMRAVGRRSPSPGWWISQETFCQHDRVYEETSLSFKSSKGVAEEAAEPMIRPRTETIIFWGSFWTMWSILVLDCVIWAFLKASLHEGTTSWGPLSKKSGGDFGYVLGWSFLPVRHDARMYHLMFKV